MNGTSGQLFSASFNAERPSNEGKRVIRKNQINSALLERSQELASSIDPGYFADDIFRLQQFLNQLRVIWIVLQR